MPTPHKWAKEIKAWADGETIEIRNTTAPEPDDQWHTISNPAWFTTIGVEYRIQPKKKKPGEVYYNTVYGGRWKSYMDGVNSGAIAVIEAYKRGELDYD